MRRWTRASLFLASAVPLLATAAASNQLHPLKGPRADVAALLLVGGESGTLRTTGLAVSPCAMTSGDESETKKLPVRLHVEIEGQSLLDAVAAHDETTLPESVRLELYVYAMNRGGEIVDSRSVWVRFSLAELAAQLPGGGVVLVQELEVPVGDYQLRTLVREPRSQQFSLRILGLQVRDGTEATPFISPPMFLEEETSWLVASSAAVGQSPSALPVLISGVPRQFTLQGCHLTGSTIEVRFLTRESQPVPGVRVEVDPAKADGLGQTAKVEIEVTGVEPGLYLLQATVAGNGSSSEQTLPVFITASESITTWADLGLLGPSEPPTESPSGKQVASSSKKVRVLEDSYLRALARLASGRLEEAVSSLASLEQAALEAHQNPRKAIKSLTQAQNRVTARVLAHDPECILPVLLLHLELHDRYTAAGNIDSQLLHATRTRIRSLAQVYATDARQEMAPSLAATALVELANAFERSGYLTSALLILRESLALDNQNTDVVLNLAYQYEHHRFHAEALNLLDHLLDLQPRSDEGRLRMAMLLFRLERHGEALALLRQLVGDARSEWVLAVAYQELAHDLLRQEEFERAVDLLEQAVGRLPEIQRLRIELSYALDRAGRRQRAREVVENLASMATGPSPRLNYRVPDRRTTGRSRADLLRHSTARLPLLASALDSDERSN